MKIAFTLCSNNYLAQAKSLGDSLLRNNPDYKFVIGLVDRVSEKIDYQPFEQFEIIEVHSIGIAQLQSMFELYNIIEFNTSVKPFYINYLLSKYQAELVIYFDPDILIYQPFIQLEANLKVHDIVLTPHINTPISEEERVPDETNFLNHGIYNLGFIAVSNTPNVSRFVDWWQSRLVSKCLIDYRNGLFVDQLWINFVPLFFEKVFIEKSAGYNMAYWNFHERWLTNQKGSYVVNETDPLVFFHFSSYNPNFRDKIAKSDYSSESFSSRPDLINLYDHYGSVLLANRYNVYRNIECYYIQKRKEFIAAQKEALVQKLLEKERSKDSSQAGISQLGQLYRQYGTLLLDNNSSSYELENAYFKMVRWKFLLKHKNLLPQLFFSRLFRKR